MEQTTVKSELTGCINMDKKGIVVIKDNQVIASGINLVVDFDYDEIIEVDFNVAKQIEKYEYKDNKLQLKEDEILLSNEEYEESLEPSE